MNKMETIMNTLIESGDISSYKLEILDIDDEVVEDMDEGFRNTERLTVIFPSGSQLVVGTFCSGSAENTCLCFEQE